MPDQSPFDLTGIIRYQDRAALLAALQRTDIRPSRRTEKRTTQQTEKWTICRLLSTLAEADKLEYPLSAAHKDRPDFLILADDAAIGIEITEAVPPQYAEFMTLAAREFPNALIEPGHFRWDSPRRTIPEMRKLLSQSKLTSPGWVGDQPEQEWAGFIEGVVRTKLEKLAVPEFAKFSQNCLAIYDNTPFIVIDHEVALSHLLPRLSTVWTKCPTFDAIYIDSDPVLLKLTLQGASSWDLTQSHHQMIG